MVNPFDRNFFKFFIGFVLILCISFGLLYIVGKYVDTDDNISAVLER